MLATLRAALKAACVASPELRKVGSTCLHLRKVVQLSLSLSLLAQKHGFDTARILL